MNQSTTRPTLPDHLSIDARSPHHVPAVFEFPIGIRFNGKERSDVEEYCISEGWIKVPAGKTLDRKGRPLLIKLKGKVEAYYEDQAATGADSTSGSGSDSAPPAPASNV